MLARDLLDDLADDPKYRYADLLDNHDDSRKGRSDDE